MRFLLLKLLKLELNVGFPVYYLGPRYFELILNVQSNFECIFLV